MPKAPAQKIGSTLSSNPLPSKRAHNPSEKGQHAIDITAAKKHAVQQSRKKGAAKSNNRAPAHVQEELCLLKEQVAILHGELEQTKVSEEAAVKHGNRYKAMVQKHNKARDDANKDSNKVADGSIPRPRGRLHLQMDMGLKGQDKLYDTLYDSVIEVLHNSGANQTVYWMQQPLDLHAKVIQVVRKREPFMTCFAGDWATQGIVAQHLSNRIGHLRRNRKHNPNSTYNLKRRLRGFIGRRGRRAAAQATATQQTGSKAVQDTEMTEGQDDGMVQEQDEVRDVAMGEELDEQDEMGHDARSESMEGGDRGEHEELNQDDDEDDEDLDDEDCDMGGNEDWEMSSALTGLNKLNIA
ncbi:hypothetical protein BOTBODRAFT_176935 [Botryobasidium botryosum FD-172 SS1]|uniref:Uncharacterized protein n=1 Tax=Botryobasidium botryosum (strain FD-172 SS1) TaxID=930990 RepID=A0A067M849_BOTB1|nr:hypothetical protein BOTBODRAFT_176935 [Botryobasidium botryosum FD-172 SS1]